MADYVHYGWAASPFSAKTRAYFRYKALDFEDRSPTFRFMATAIQKRIGRMVMPVVVVDDGTWLQDTAEIIDVLEERHPEPAILPSTPTQRLAAMLLELFADEWFTLSAMHYRWNYEENRRFIVSDFGKSAAPTFPGSVQRRLGERVARTMRSYLPVLGITPVTAPAIEKFTAEVLDAIEQTVASQRYLLGERPSLADVALVGTIYSHLWRDPASHPFVAERKNLLRWIDDTHLPTGAYGGWLENDRVPDSLDPIFRRQFNEQWPVLVDTMQRVGKWAKTNDRKRIPRSLGKGEFQIGDVRAQRSTLTFGQWKAQRPLDFYRTLAPEQKQAVDVWLQRVGGYEAMQFVPELRVKRENYQIVRDES
ncbi:MAG: glutathione S-transferase family protein [Polyangiales bacterium]